MQMQRRLVIILALVITILTAYILIARQFAYSRVLVDVTRDHGLHLADLPVLGLWLIGMFVCTMLWSKPPPPAPGS